MATLFVDGEVAQGGTGGTLHLDVGVLEQEEDGLQGVAVDLSDISLCDLSKGQAGGALQVDVVGIDQGAEGAEGFAGEEVSLCAVL